MDRSSFLLFVRAVLPERAPEALSGRAPEVGGQVLTKTSCRPRLHCAEWSRVVLSDSPRHYNGSGRDWPDKSPRVYQLLVDTALRQGIGSWRDAYFTKTRSTCCLRHPDV